MTLAARTLYKQTLLDLFLSWTLVRLTSRPTPAIAAPLASTEHNKDTATTIVETSPHIESMNEAYINALIAMEIELMQDLQNTNTTKMDSMLATIDRMTYNHCTHSTQIPPYEQNLYYFYALKLRAK